MNKFLFTLLVGTLLGVSLKAQSFEPTHWLDNGLYKVGYNVELEQPISVSYTVKCPDGQADRAGMNFYTIDDFPTSDDDDYSNNIWDKGHMAPAASFSCNEDMLYKTFSYANSALQHQSLNRGVWRELEDFERNLSNFYTVFIQIDILFEGEFERLETGAAVPSGFRKTLIFDEKKVVFEFPNEDTRGTKWINYIVELS